MNLTNLPQIWQGLTIQKHLQKYLKNKNPRKLKLITQNLTTLLNFNRKAKYKPNHLVVYKV